MKHGYAKSTRHLRSICVSSVAKTSGTDLPACRIPVSGTALAADLESAITTLPHDMRAAFVLYEINGQRYREIGQVLKCTEKAVERRLAKARERLRAILEPKWRNTE